MLGSDKMEKKKNVVDNTKVEETNNPTITTMH